MLRRTKCKSHVLTPLLAHLQLPHLRAAFWVLWITPIITVASGKALGETDEKVLSANSQKATVQTVNTQTVNAQAVNTQTASAQNREQSCVPSNDQQRLLELVNQARSQQRTCGGSSLPAAAPLQWSCKLESIAKMHSNDMATNNFMDHQGSDRSSPNERASNAGYNWRSVGENVAAGQHTPESVMESWLSSPGHCSNIMRQSFTEMGADSARNEQSDYKIYWTLMFGQPLSQP